MQETTFCSFNNLGDKADFIKSTIFNDGIAEDRVGMIYHDYDTPRDVATVFFLRIGDSFTKVAPPLPFLMYKYLALRCE